MSIQVFCPFSNQVVCLFFVVVVVVGFLFLGGFLMLNCMSCLYILDINPLSVTSFANIFSHLVGLVGCLFVFVFFPLPYRSF